MRRNFSIDIIFSLSVGCEKIPLFVYGEILMFDVEYLISHRIIDRDTSRHFGVQ